MEIAVPRKSKLITRNERPGSRPTRGSIAPSRSSRPSRSQLIKATAGFMAAMLPSSCAALDRNSPGTAPAASSSNDRVD